MFCQFIGTDNESWKKLVIYFIKLFDLFYGHTSTFKKIGNS